MAQVKKYFKSTWLKLNDAYYHTKFNKNSFSILPILLAITILGFKAFKISLVIKNEFDAELFFQLFRQDLAYIVVLATCIFISKFLLKNLLKSFIILANLIYLIDTYLIVTLDHHLTITLVESFYRDIFKIQGLLPVLNILILILFLLISTFQYPVLVLKNYVIIFFLLFTVASLEKDINQVDRFKFPPKFTKYKISNKYNNFYSEENAAISEKLFDKNFEIELPNNNPNIILIAIESYSASYSKRTSGIDDLTPKIDEISKDGIIFTNFHANYVVSEGALVALLNAVAPLPYPGNNFRMMNSYSGMPSVIDLLKIKKYYTKAIFGLDTSFANTNSYLKSLKFDETIDKKDFILPEDLPKQALGSVPDKMLFDNFLSGLGKMSTPYLAFIATTSTHKPWTDPEGIQNSKKRVWEYIDQQIFEFYQNLKRNGFFNNGVLLITSDHKAPDPISIAEKNKFGASANYRIPLIIVGSNIAKEQIDHRQFQQSDLIKKLNSISDLKKPLSEHITTVSSYTRSLWDDKKIGHFTVFDKDKAYEALTYGSKIEWLNDKPKKYSHIESQIHNQRAAYQRKSLIKKRQCGKRYDPMPNPLIRGIEYKSISKRFLATNLTSIKLDENFELIGFLKINKSGYYFFEMPKTVSGCLAIDNRTLINQNNINSYLNPEILYLESGLHKINAVIKENKDNFFELRWKSRDHGDLTQISLENLVPPKGKINTVQAQEGAADILDSVFIFSAGPLDYAPRNSELLLNEAINLGYHNIHLDITLNNNQIYLGKNKLNSKLGVTFAKEVLNLDERIIQNPPNDPWLNTILKQKPILLSKILLKYSAKTQFLLEVDLKKFEPNDYAIKLDQVIKNYHDKIWIQSSNFDFLKKMRSINNKYRLILLSDNYSAVDYSVVNGLTIDSDLLTKEINQKHLVFADNIYSKNQYYMLKRISDFQITDADLFVNGKLEPLEFFNSKSEKIKIYDSISKVESRILTDKNYSRVTGKNNIYFINHNK